jgi:GMP synthase (glutamine-hydrolysing)
LVQLAHETVIVLDFGSQYTQLIARRVREAGVYCEILPYNSSSDQILSRRPGALIFSGGPSSVYEETSPKPDPTLLNQIDCPVLGICYGIQFLAADLGGEVHPSDRREYGNARLTITSANSPLFGGLPREMDVWLSHGDHVTKIPAGFQETASTGGALNAFEDLSRRIFGVQFHPEVAHTQFGIQIIKNFLFNISNLKGDWTPEAIITEQVNRIQNQIGTGKAICGLSGGVDSAVAAALTQRAIGNRQICIFVDNGLLREGEFESTLTMFKEGLNLNVKGVDESDKFLTALHGITDPEKKRQLIGHAFIDIFEREAGLIGDVDFLVQGTLYPDVIESVSVKGPSAIIKSHHNVGGLPKTMRLRLVEPLRELFKDEVRIIGRELGIPIDLINRHPFPGPGLAVRIIGEINKDSLKLLRAADRIIEEELRCANLYESVWQAFPVLLPVSTVGVMGDFRTYEKVVAIRAVTSNDGMTADWARLPHDVLGKMSTRLVSEVRGINRVVYDISSKPPSTIEWE